MYIQVYLKYKKIEIPMLSTHTSGKIETMHVWGISSIVTPIQAQTPPNTGIATPIQEQPLQYNINELCPDHQRPSRDGALQLIHQSMQEPQAMATSHPTPTGRQSKRPPARRYNIHVRRQHLWEM